MPDLSTALSALTVGLTLSERSAQSEQAESVSNGNGDSETLSPEGEMQKQTKEAQQTTNDRLQKLLEIEDKRQPTPGDKDAFASVTFELDPGETATVTVEPVEGFNLRAKRVYFDRRVDHEYELNVGGDVTSVNHKAEYMSPKLVSQGDRVSATVTNRSNDPTVIDFEMKAWAEQPGSGI